MIKGGINGAFAAKVTHLTFVSMRSITLPNLVPIGLYLTALRPFKTLKASLPLMGFEPATYGRALMAILHSAPTLYTNEASIFVL